MELSSSRESTESYTQRKRGVLLLLVTASIRNENRISACRHSRKIHIHFLAECKARESSSNSHYIAMALNEQLYQRCVGAKKKKKRKRRKMAQQSSVRKTVSRDNAYSKNKKLKGKQKNEAHFHTECIATTRFLVSGIQTQI